MASQTICPDILGDVNLTISPCIVESISVHSFLYEFFDFYTIILWRNEKRGKNSPKIEEGNQEYLSFASTKK